MTRLFRLHSSKRVAYLFIFIGLLLAAGAIFLLLRDPSPAAPSPNTDQFTPSSVKPTAQQIAGYQVAPDLPRYINIPAIKVPTSRVISLGANKKNQIVAPANIYDAGWYKRSAKPGQAGAMFIYGHVSSWDAKGLFFNLRKLKPGDKVTVTRGDNKKFTYTVISSKTYNYKKVDMHQALSPIQAGKPGLNLMTCAGKIIKGTNEFDERVVVFTSLSN